MSRSRWGGFKKGKKLYKRKWQALKTDQTDIVSAPTTSLEFDYTTAQGIWSLNSTIQFRKSQPVDIESSLTITNSFSAGTINNADINRFLNVVFACDITLPTNFNSNGVLFEMGGTGTGGGVGLINSGSNLIVAAGDGGTATTNTTAAIASINTSELTPGDSGTLVWEFRISPGRVRVWWNGVLIAEESTSGGGNLESNSWSGSDGGGYGQVNNSLITALTSGNWPGTTNSSLRYYENQLVQL